MQYVTVVDPQWLAEMGPMFFSLKLPNQVGSSRYKRMMTQNDMEEQMQEAVRRQTEEKEKKEVEEEQIRDAVQKKRMENESVRFGKKKSLSKKKSFTLL